MWLKAAVIIPALCLSSVVRAQAPDSGIELPGGEITVGELFALVEKQSGMLFGYATADIDPTHTVVLAQGTYRIESLLDWLFRDMPLRYSISGNHILISRTDEPADDGFEPVVYIKYGVVRPRLAVKTNLLCDLTGTINLSVEIALAPKWTLDIPVNYNMWQPASGRRLCHGAVQPEARWWTCERFDGWFFGAHAHYAKYNVGAFKGWPFSENMQRNRYEGYLYGAGVSAGRSWILKNRWSIEATIGVGYARLVYDKYPCAECGSSAGRKAKNYFGPTKAGLSLIYMIK